MAEYSINKFSYGGNTYKVEDNRIGSNSTGTVITAELLNIFYPIGTIYQTTNADFNPQEIFGGSWDKIEGRFLVGVGASGTNTSANDYLNVTSVGSTGGFTKPQNSYHAHNINKTHVSTASISNTNTGPMNQHSSHSHNTYYVEAKSSTTGSTRRFGPFGSSASGAQSIATNSADISHTHEITHTHGVEGATEYVSATDAGNLPPYYSVYIWKRTA